MSLNGKNSVHFRKKDLTTQKSLAFGMKKVQAWHEATVGDLSIDLQNLVMPSVGVPSYAANPAFADIAAAKLLLNPTNLILISSYKGVLSFDDYEIKSNSEITLKDAAVASEIFSITIDYVAKSGVQMIDTDPLVVTGTLAASATSFATGKPFEVNKFPSGQQGAILVFLDGQLMARNVSNAAAAPGADGDYQEIDAGNGTGISIEFNASAGVDRSVMIVNSGVMGIAPSDSVIAQIENVAGQVDRLVETVAALAGIAESELQSAPNSVDLLAFGSRMDDAEADIVQNTADIAALPAIYSNSGTVAISSLNQMTSSDSSLLVKYTVIGDVVTLSGVINIDPNNTNNQFMSFEWETPADAKPDVNFSSTRDAIGGGSIVISSGVLPDPVLNIQAVSGSKRIKCVGLINDNSLSNGDYQFTCQYNLR